jgi:type I restriction enzyme S subunit
VGEKKLWEIILNINDRVASSNLTINNYISTENLLSDFQGTTPATSLPTDVNVIAFKKNDVLLSNIRPYLKKIWIANVNGGCSTDVFVFRSNEECSPRFLYYSIANSHFIDYVMVGAKGVKMPRGDKQHIQQYPLYIPSQQEQEKITRFLSLLDERISTQNKIIEKYESLIKGINNHLHNLYGDEVEVSLAQLGNSYNGLSGKSGSDFGSGKPYITYMNVYQNNIIDESMIGYVKVTNEERQNTVCYGDALFTISSETPNEVGINAVYLANNKELYLNSFCFGYRLHDFSILNPEYMPYCFSSNQFRKFVYPLAQGSTRFNLHMTDFQNKKIKIPTIENQIKILNLLNSISGKLIIEKNMASVLQQQKLYLLRSLFI